VAVKIVRQTNKLALLGAPTSAAAMSAGLEGAPTALRAAGLVDRLKTIGYAVADLGDDPVQLYKPDEESPRARNLSRVLASLESLKPRVEQAVKSSALPLILAGDCTVALATVAGARRYFRKVSMIYMDRDADLNTPATTATGCVDGMVVSHLAGRGAAELVRFWGEPPLVREPDLALFGVARLDAHAAIDRIRGNGYQFVLHLDVDVIADFAATNYPGSGGLSLAEVREALLVFAQQPELAAFELTAYNPTKDADGSGAKLIIDLLTEVLEARLKTLQATAAAAAPAPVAAAAAAGRASSPSPEKAISAQDAAPAAAPGEAWSSDSLDLDSDAASSNDAIDATEASETSDGSSEESSGSHS
jgi:arginase